MKKALVLLIAIVSAFACAAQECTHDIRVNGHPFVLNKTTRADIATLFGATSKESTRYEVPFYSLCYQAKDGLSAIIFGVESETDIVTSASIVVWDSVLDGHLKCEQLQFNRISINGKHIGQRVEKNGKSQKDFVSRQYCTIWETQSVISRTLVGFGAALSKFD